MKKIFIIIILIININNIFSQESENSECDKMTRQASVDFSNEKYVYGNYIGISSIKKDYEFEKFYQLYLKSEFNIETITTGCTSLLEEYCYLNTMDSLLGKKFNYGKSFFDTNRIYQKKRFKKLNNKEKAKVLNNDKFYSDFLEHKPIFKGKKSKLREYFKLHFEMSKYEKSFGVEMSIDKNGILTDLKVFYPEILRDKEIIDKPEMIKELNQLGKWKSGKIFNKKVNSISTIRI
jgi:hypothetical protein